MGASKPKTGSWIIVVLLLMILAVIVENIVLFVVREFPFDRRLLYLLGLGAAVIALAAVIAVSAQLFAGRRAMREERGKVSVTSPPCPPRAGEVNDEQAVVLLSLLQEKGRFVDFVMEDVAPFSNEQVGGAARVVHQGCREVIKECFDPKPVADKKENTEVVLERDFDASEYRLSGRVSGGPPYRGMLVHKGWKAGLVRLPRPALPAKDVAGQVIVPAEVNV